ncbi:unnamed protein product [Heterotrigona itama]|uniref:Uncharacterized protein n=1 Tax=Heterotrigona itama TaxID=395501 RepID=A0A6V7H4A9_9HYME|nr:unnamed protein product [Heterotrigona itama]
MGDEKPSHFLQRLRNLAGNNVPDSILKTVFLEQIPTSLHDILMASDSNDLARLAALADKITEFKSSQVSAMSQRNATFETNNVQDNNMATGTRLKNHRANQTNDSIEDGKAPTRTSTLEKTFKTLQQTSYSSTTITSCRNTGLCYYHRRFGQQACRCTTPCPWRSTPSERNTVTATPTEN